MTLNNSFPESLPFLQKAGGNKYYLDEPLPFWRKGENSRGEY